MAYTNKDMLGRELGGQPSPDYTQALSQAETELQTRLEQQRWIAERIEYLKATVITLRQLSGQQNTSYGSFVSGLLGIDRDAGLTENVRRILATTPGPVSAMFIRDRLSGAGFNLSKYDNPLAMIHTVLSRLVAMGEARPLRDESNNRIAAYEWLGGR